MNSRDLQFYIREKVALAGSQAKLAQMLGISEAYLSDILNGKRHPGPKVLEALHLEKGYFRKGHVGRGI